MIKLPFEIHLEEIINKENLTLIKGNKEKYALYAAENLGNPFLYKDAFIYGIVNGFKPNHNLNEILNNLRAVQEIVFSNITQIHKEYKSILNLGKTWKNNENNLNSRVYFPTISLEINDSANYSYLKEVLKKEYSTFEKLDAKFPYKKTSVEIVFYPSVKYANNAIVVFKDNILLTNNKLQEILNYK